MSRPRSPALIVAAILCNSLFAHEVGAAAKAGDHVFLRMTGDVAREYARLTGTIPENGVPAGLEIETTATITQVLEDGQLRIEHSSNVIQNGRRARLITLTGTVDRDEVVTDVTPKGTPVYSSPEDHNKGSKPTATNKDAKSLRLQLSGLKGLRLRSWSLVEEIGE